MTAKNDDVLGTTRLSISGVKSTVAVRVAQRRDARVTVEQRLPFLAIGTEVADERGQTGRIERVGVALEGGVPKLVLELAYDVLPRPSTPSGRRGDQTISYERPTIPEPIRPVRAEAQGEPAPTARTAASSHPLRVAFPLEKRREAPRSWLARWLGSFF